MLYRLAFVFVFTTGFTGLVYQVTWHKYLAFQLGSHALATALVLAVFFLFLSLGYFALGRNIHRIPLKNKLFVYGIIEALIGFYALVSPPLFHLLADWLPPGGGSQTGDFLLGFGFTTLYIGIPTFLMGTTIPVLTQALARDYESSHATHAAVYGLNTLGAVLGALLTGFVLIEHWGLPLTLLNTGILNILIGFATYLIWKARPDSFAGVAPETAPTVEVTVEEKVEEKVEEPRTDAAPGWVLLLFFVSFASGFYVFSLENVMIRLAGLVIGSSNYTFAMIVAAFILGIALGSLWVGRRVIRGPRFFLGVQLALLASSVLLYLLVPSLPEWFARVRVIFAPAFINIPLYWTAVFVLFALILLLPVALMGMNLPLIFNYLRSRGLFLSQTVGRIYAVNTLGSVLGSLIGGYLLFFVLRWDGVFRFNLALIALTIPFILGLAGYRRALVASAALLPVLVFFALPRWDDHAFLPAPANIIGVSPTDTSLEPGLERLRRDRSLEYVYHGPAAHIGVLRGENGEPQLHINGNPNTGGSDWELRAMNAIYPLSFVREPKSAFVVGLGGGLSASIFAEMPSIERVLVSEIAIGAIKALPYFDEQNADFTTQPYFDKVEFVPADAIKVLRSTQERFDVIVSEPNHPWVAGVENLFTVEFLTEVRDRLTDDGVYCQWFPLFVAEPGIVLTILNTFREVFPEVRAFSTGGGTFSIVAANRPLQPDLAHIEQLLERVGPRLEARNSDFTDPVFLLATEVLNDWALSEIVADFDATQTFEFPVIASNSFRAKFAGVRTSMNNDVLDRLHRLPPEGPGGEMLLAGLRPQLTAQDLDRIQTKIANRGALGFAILPRLWYQRSTWFDSAPDWPPESQRQILAYVSGLSNAIPESMRGSETTEEPAGTIGGDADTEGGAEHPRLQATGVAGQEQANDPEQQDLRTANRLFSTYRQLIRAHVPARLDRVIREIPEDCESVNCARLQRAIISTALPASDAIDELNDQDLNKPENRVQVSRLFAQLRSALAEQQRR